LRGAQGQARRRPQIEQEPWEQMRDEQVEVRTRLWVGSLRGMT